MPVVQVHRKLVRDKIPEKIQAHGERAVLGQLTGDSLVRALVMKVLEEALEIYWAEGEEAIKDELADIYTVLDSLVDHLGISREEFRDLYKKKLELRGGFDKGILLHQTEEPRLVGMLSNGPKRSDDSLLESKASINIDQLEDVESGGDAAEASIIDLAPRPHRKGSQLILPLIPPNPARRHVSFLIELPFESLKVNVRYGEKQILLETSKLTSRAATEGNQLSLFDVK